MPHADIAAAMKKARLEINIDDTAQGSVFLFVTPSGRANNYNRFEANVIRIGADWRINGMAHDPRGPQYSASLEVAYRENDHSIMVRFHTWIFRAGLSAGIFDMVNSPVTGELYISVLRDVGITEPAQYHAVLKAGSQLYFRDTN